MGMLEMVGRDEDVPVVELECVKEIYVESIARLVRSGTCTKAYFFTIDELPDGRPVKVIVAKLIIQTDNIMPCMRMTAEYLCSRAARYLCDLVARQIH